MMKGFFAESPVTIQSTLPQLQNHQSSNNSKTISLCKLFLPAVHAPHSPFILNPKSRMNVLKPPLRRHQITK